jgi:hypothetical protein
MPHMAGMRRRKNDPHNMRAIARRLRALKIAFYGADSPNAGFAQLLDVSPAHWSHVSKPMPVQLLPVPMAYKICAVTGVTFDYLYRGSFANLPVELVPKLQGAMAQLDREEGDT